MENEKKDLEINKNLESKSEVFEEIQTTFNNDNIDELVEDGIIENAEEVTDNGDKNK